MTLDNDGVYAARRHGTTHAIAREALEPYTDPFGHIAWRRPHGQLTLDLQS